MIKTKTRLCRVRQRLNAALTNHAENAASRERAGTFGKPFAKYRFPLAKCGKKFKEKRTSK